MTSVLTKLHRLFSPEVAVLDLLPGEPGPPTYGLFDSFATIASSSRANAPANRARRSRAHVVDVEQPVLPFQKGLQHLPCAHHPVLRKLINAYPSPSESIRRGERCVRIQRIITGIENAQVEASFHFFTPVSEAYYNIKSGDVRRRNTAVHGGFAKVEVEAPRLRVPGAGFLPDTLYVAEPKRPFR